MAALPRRKSDFTIIRVRINGRRQDGFETKNKYSIDVEVSWGIFPVLIRHNKKARATKPLDLHPDHEAILTAVSELVTDLESRGLIGHKEGGSVLELNPASEGAEDRTKAISTFLRQTFAAKELGLELTETQKAVLSSSAKRQPGRRPRE